MTDSYTNISISKLIKMISVELHYRFSCGFFPLLKTLYFPVFFAYPGPNEIQSKPVFNFNRYRLVTYMMRTMCPIVNAN